MLACPLCRLALQVGERTARCAAGHSYDRAKEGHLNLFRPGKAHKDVQGDDKDMVRARRRFLSLGHYAVLADGLGALVDELAPAAVVDVGCGEGSFTASMVGAGREVVAFDLSREGVRLAARLLGRDATCIVAGIHDIPVLERSSDLVCSVMSPTHEAEFVRVARPGGRIVVVSPGAAHLDGLRRLLYRDYRPHDEVAPLAGRFDVARTDRFTAPIVLTTDEAHDAWAMTPYRWNAPAEGVERLAEVESLEVTVDFVATTYRVPG